MEFKISVQMNTVGRKEFAMFIAVENFLFIRRTFTETIVFLNASSGWCVVTLYREALSTAVGERDLTLHKPLTETASPYNQGTIIILHCSSKYLAG